MICIGIVLSGTVINKSHENIIYNYKVGDINYEN